jgi:Ca2+-binding RTX toxin-like protein
MHSAGLFLRRAALPGLWLCSLQSGAQALPPEFQVNTITNLSQFDSAVSALSDGGFVVAWHDTDSLSAKAQRFTATATKVGGEITVPDMTGTMSTTLSIGPYVTGLVGGGAVVAWSGSEDDVADASASGVAAQIFDGNFVKLGTKFHVNTTTAGKQIVGGVAPLANGGFVVTWESAPLSGATGQDGSGRGIYARRFAADGSPAGGQFRVNTATTNDQKQPRIAALANGGFVVVWMDDGQDTYKAQRFSSSGSPVGGETVIGFGALTTGVAGLEGGGFVTIWTGEVDGVGTEACVRVFNANGVAVTGEFQANTYNVGAQQALAVDGLASGGYVVLWTSDAQDGGLLGVYGQKFTSASFNDGGEFRVNVRTADAQRQPSVAALGSGFVATWTSDKQDGSGKGIYGRLFGNTSNVIVGTSGPDNLTGTTGNDTINGKGGADIMQGLAGNDTYVVDNVGDSVVEKLDEGTDTIRSSVTYSLPANVENLVLTGTAATNGAGNNLANKVTGNSGNNTLNGALGRDVLTGGAGVDQFLFKTALNATTNVDRIEDFSVADERILLRKVIFAALTTTGTLSAASFRVGSAATNASHRIIYNSTTGSLSYDADGSGPIAAIRFAQLAPGLALTNANFIVQ